MAHRRSSGRLRPPSRRGPARLAAGALLGGVAAAALSPLFADDLRSALLGVLLVALLVPIALIDVERRVIPNRLTGPGAIAAVAIGLATDPAALPAQLAAGAAAGGLLLLAAVARPDGMGMGDVKLAGLIGLCLGPTVAVALLLAFVAAALFGVAVIARDGLAAGRRTTFPFGPFLAVGAVAALLAGQPVLDWYLG
ncbi:prepilin peptidase [Conexibacter arvalis]|uniref:Leader peptidase (Prepilin peptidase)/N-methyltransferase n=1 Tax=Conexibacter arvalis TaxID=912552 RepID=A0A840ILH0_9ACTN|nr:A24 family peptidase [Conexibacter arvalis]MBB4664844.1 leader peptidase (prepilin peptidase)/N-methyltransferase [Conexibacter arvalis]